MTFTNCLQRESKVLGVVGGGQGGGMEVMFVLAAVALAMAARKISEQGFMSRVVGVFYMTHDFPKNTIKKQY